MAADTYSSRIGAILQGTGNNNNSWGVNLNSALELLDKSIAGLYANTVTGGTLDLDNVIPPAGAHPLADMLVDLDGTLASDQIVLVPNVSKLWFVRNACDGAFTLKFKTASGVASAAIPQGGWCPVWCNGANVFFVGLSTALRDVQWQGPDGTLALPGVSFAAQSSLGMRRVSAGVMALVVGGVDIVTISATGINIAANLAISIGGASIVPPGTEASTLAIRAPNGWYFEYGQALLRATDAPLMAAITEGFTANTNGTVTLSNVSKDLRGLGLEGADLEGVGIFTGATIVSIDSATQITMSNAATNTATGGAVMAFPYGNGDGSTTFDLPNANGTVAAARDNMGGTAAGRLTTAGSGVDGTRLNTIHTSQTVTLARANLPNTSVTVTVTDPGHYHPTTRTDAASSQTNGGGFPGAVNATNTITGSATTGISAAFNLNGGVTQTGVAVVQPTRIRNVIIKR